VSFLFGVKGREWLGDQILPVDERLTVDARLRQLDFLGEELGQIDGLIAQDALKDPDIKRLMTIPGVDVTTAAPLVGHRRRAPGSRPRSISPATSG
jgi:transposase